MSQERCPSCGQIIRTRAPDLDARMREQWRRIESTGRGDQARALMARYRAGEVDAGAVIIELAQLLGERIENIQIELDGVPRAE